MSRHHDDTSKLTETVGRRTFLRVLGSVAPAAAVVACSPVPPERIIPYVVPPEDVIPGVATWYASVCGECPAGCGTLVRTREGRAVKVEGNPEHPVNRGSLCIRGQSSLQGLYNPDRLDGPLARRVTNESTGQSVLERVGWEPAQEELVERIQSLLTTGQRGRIAVVTPLMTGTLDTLVDVWSEAIGARRIRYEPFAYEAIRSANQATFGRDVIPHHDFSKAELVVSFGADFQETWLSTVEHTRDHTAARRVRNGRKTRFVQVGPRLSLTGASADQWLQIEPGMEALLAAAMVHVILSEERVLAPELTADQQGQIVDLVADTTPDTVTDRVGIPPDQIRELARAFADPAVGVGRTLAVGGGVAATGENATTTQIAVNLLNTVAGNIGTTVVFSSDTSWGSGQHLSGHGGADRGDAWWRDRATDLARGQPRTHDARSGGLHRSVGQRPVRGQRVKLPGRDFDACGPCAADTHTARALG